MTRKINDVISPNYIIYYNGRAIDVKNGVTGTIDFSGTDASTVIQNTIDTLTNGGKIFIKSGTYTINSAITLKNNIHIKGSPSATTLKLANNANTNLFQITTSLNRIICEDFILDGNKANNISGTGIYADNAWMCRFKNLQIENFKSYGLKFIKSTTLQDNWFENIYVLYCDGIACHINGSDMFLTNCNFSSTQQALKLQGANFLINGLHTWGVVDPYNEIEINATDVYINNAYIESKAAHKLYINNERGSISNAYIYGYNNETTGHGIFFDKNAYWWNVSGCIIRKCGQHGIYLHQDRISISNSVIYENKQHGIYCDVWGPHRISNCYIYRNSTGADNTYDGINIATGAALVIIEGNYIYDTPIAKQRYGIYDSGGGSSIIIGNRISGNATGQVYPNNNSIMRNNYGYKTESNILSLTFAIDSTGVKTVIIAHGLAITPAVQDCYLTVVEYTPVDDWAYSLLKVISTGSKNVIVKINVSTASATVGATAKLALRVGNP